MKYREILDWMFAQLPMYQRQGASAYKTDLTNTIHLATYLGDPQTQFKSVHVAGTNGKGSASHMLASILQEASYKVGLYTSPHLKDFRERIRINGKKITETYVENFINSHKSYFEKNQLSFFEMTVGMAFQYFVDTRVDIAIIEVGLGGRLDSTNIIIPEVSIITNIGLDHTQFLGNTLTEIALEKAGIIKQSVPVVIGRATKETEKVFREVATAHQSELYYASDYDGMVYSSDLKGNYQQENIKTVLQTIVLLQQQGWKISDQNIQNGLSNVVNNTSLLGRWQVLQQAPKVICDTAHNTDGLKLVLQQVLHEEYEHLHIVLGVVNDKKLDDILLLFPTEATYYFSKPDIPRGLSGGTLKEMAAGYKLIGEHYKTVSEAYNVALQNASVRDLIYVGGSTFVVAEII